MQFVDISNLGEPTIFIFKVISLSETFSPSFKAFLISSIPSLLIQVISKIAFIFSDFGVNCFFNSL